MPSSTNLLDIVATIPRPIAVRQNKATAKAQHRRMTYEMPRHSLVRLVEPFTYWHHQRSTGKMEANTRANHFYWIF
jgi:hypothetical protein